MSAPACGGPLLCPVPPAQTRSWLTRWTCPSCGAVYARATYFITWKRAFGSGWWRLVRQPAGVRFMTQRIYTVLLVIAILAPIAVWLMSK